jgi:hypothetical protein
VADTTRETSVTELGMIEHATTGGVARTNGFAPDRKKSVSHLKLKSFAPVGLLRL